VTGLSSTEVRIDPRNVKCERERVDDFSDGDVERVVRI
jgi:hypothetical protein